MAEELVCWMPDVLATMTQRFPSRVCLQTIRLLGIIVPKTKCSLFECISVIPDDI